MSQASESCISSSEEWFKKNPKVKKKTKSARKSKWVTDPYLREKLRAAVWEYQYLADFDKKYKQPSKQNIEARYKIPRRTLTRAIGKITFDESAGTPLPPREVKSYILGFEADNYEPVKIT